LLLAMVVVTPVVVRKVVVTPIVVLALLKVVKVPVKVTDVV